MTKKANGVFFKMTVFKVTGADEKKVRKILNQADNTFGPLGSGGFSFLEQGDGSFIMRYLDCDPAPAARIRLKNNEIWVPSQQGFAVGMLGCLAAQRLTFSSKTKKFGTPEEARKAFGN